MSAGSAYWLIGKQHQVAQIGKCLIVKIAGERCAVPLARVERVLQVPREELQAVTGRQYIFLEEERVEILSAAEVLELVRRLDADDRIDGILVQLPLPPQIDPKAVNADFATDRPH